MIPATPVSPQTLTHRQIQSGIGSIIGSAVGDALGAPFEFKAPGSYAERFPRPILGGVGEMIGGGGFDWAPGEFTDDTQMAMALAEALVCHEGEFVPEMVWELFVAWSDGAKDIGSSTHAALQGRDYLTAARDAHEALGRSASNGSLMRIAPVGVMGVRWGTRRTVEIAREQSALTHFDNEAGWSAAIAAETIRSLVLGATFEESLARALSMVEGDLVPMFGRFLDSSWVPTDTDGRGNGSAVICLAQAVWAVRTTESFEEAVVAAINLGDDADTVGAVTGAIAGALYGIQQIPARWTTYVHGSVRQLDGSVTTYRQHDLVAMAHNLMGVLPRAMVAPEPVIDATEVHELGVFAANYRGAIQADPSMAIVSLCRMEENLSHAPHRREFHIIDEWGQGHNPHLGSVTRDAVLTIEAFLAEGREVLVHCHGGRSRTGFILKAWYMHRNGVDHDAADDWLSQRWPHYVRWNTDFDDFLSNEWGMK